MLAPIVVVAAPRPGRPVAIVVAAGTGAGEAVHLVGAAGGRYLGRIEHLPVVIAVFDEPGFGGRLWRAGTWGVVDAALFRACM